MSAYKQQRRRRRWLLELAFSSRPSVHMFASRSVCVWFMIMLAFFNCCCLKARSCSDVQTLALCFVCNGVATFCFRCFPKTPFLLYVNLKRLVFLVVIGVILFVWLECSIVRPFACLSFRPSDCLSYFHSIDLKCLFVFDFMSQRVTTLFRFMPLWVRRHCRQRSARYMPPRLTYCG